MKPRTDTIVTLDTPQVRRAACGYRINNTTCASCRYAIRYVCQCRRHGFPINIDRGTCNDHAPVAPETTPAKKPRRTK